MTGNHPHAITQVVGDVSRYKLNTEALLNQRVGKIITKGENDLDYFYYFFKDEETHKYLASSSSGSANQANISKGDILGITSKIPEPVEQKAIAEVLSSLDDKIDLLHRQNKTIEQMAETLFRQWFVEEAQEDWEEGTLGDVAVNVRDSVKTCNIKGDAKYVGLEHIDRRNISLNQYGFGNEVNSNKSAFQARDILFGKLRPYFHKVCLAPFPGICSTDVLVIRPKTTEYLNFCLFAFFQNNVVAHATLGSGGTRMPRTNWETLKQFSIAIPDESVIISFNERVTPTIDKIIHNIKNIQTLESLRDTLLPKLMSGEIRVASNE